ncbi:MAG: hypothetical protein AAB360_02370 [Patescibacteria group bacterium]
MGTWTEAPGQISSTLQMAAEFGLNEGYWAQLRQDKILTDRLRVFLANQGIPTLPPAELRVAKVLGKDGYFGLRHWARYFAASPTDEQIKRCPNFGWPLRLLDSPCPFYPEQKIRESHIALLGLSEYGHKPTLAGQLLDLNQTNLGQSVRCEYRGYGSSTPLQFRWYLVLKTPAPGLRYLSYDKLVAQLPEDYGPVSVAEATASIIACSALDCHIGLNQPTSNWLGYPDESRTWAFGGWTSDELRQDARPMSIALSIVDAGRQQFLQGNSWPRDQADDSIGIFAQRLPTES